MKRICLFLLLLTVPTWAQPGLMVTDASVTAEGATQKPVVLSVTVENKGQEPAAGLLVVNFNPKVSGSQRGGGNTLADPLEHKQPVGPLAPGEKKVLQMQTPYDSNSVYRNQKRTFRAGNILPTGEVVVEFSTKLQPAPAR